MNTEAAKEIARLRHEYMEGFLKEYYEEIRYEYGMEFWTVGEQSVKNIIDSELSVNYTYN